MDDLEFLIVELSEHISNLKKVVKNIPETRNKYVLQRIERLKSLKTLLFFVSNLMKASEEQLEELRERILRRRRELEQKPLA